MAEIKHKVDAFELDGLAREVEAGNRAALARAITLVESRKLEHKRLARDLLSRLSRHAGRAHRIGITGVPGAGKSTVIDQLGVNLTAEGHKVAVLAVDPSSTRSGGAILGDKTRMSRLSAHPDGFVRPSPSSGTLGGVARMTREAILLCETAGYGIVIVETVGVGQSEAAVANMVDFFLVLMLAGAGDELQGIKKGILEIADMIAINKADGGNEERANAAAADYRAALHILTPPGANWKPPVCTISALENRGLDTLWSQMREHRSRLEASGEFQGKRREQDVRWMHAIVEDGLRMALKARSGLADKIAGLENQVRDGAMPASVAADEILLAAGVLQES